MKHDLSAAVAGSRINELVARGTSHRLAREYAGGRLLGRLAEVQRFAFRKALAAVALSIVLLLALASSALAVPSGSGGGGNSRVITGSTEKTSVEATGGFSLDALSLVLAAGAGALVTLIAAHKGVRKA